MLQVPAKCSECLDPFPQTAKRAEQGVTICPRCRTTLDAFVQEFRSKIDSCPKLQSSFGPCIAAVESSMAELANRNDLTRWELRRAHLVVEIGQLLLDGKIGDTGFHNLVGVLPADSSDGWSLEGLELVKAVCPRARLGPTEPGVRYTTYRTRFGPDGQSRDGGIIRFSFPDVLIERERIDRVPTVLAQTWQPASKGCLSMVTAIVLPLGFLLVLVLTSVIL
jgi:hypothetical protein